MAGLFALVLVPQAFAAPTQYVVNSPTDPGPGSCTAEVCTLHDAIDAANSDNTDSAITFSSAMTIALSGPLPDVTAPLSIDGGVAPAKVGVTIDGSNGDGVDHGIVLAAGSGGSTISGLAIIDVSGGEAAPPAGTALDVISDGNTIAGNYFGIDAKGAAGPNAIAVMVSGNRNTIGGSSDSGDGNVIAGGSGEGIMIDGSGIPAPTTPTGNVVQGNSIGVLLDGTTTDPGTTDGISLVGAQGTVVGVDATTDELFTVVRQNPQFGNVVAGAGAGILITNGTTGTVATGNFLGVDRTGASTAPNDIGIRVIQSSNNQLGPGNVSAHNTENGVDIEAGNGQSNGDRIVANSIFDNSLGGILLQGGANNGIAAPANLRVGDGVVSGTVAGVPGQSFFVEVFGNASCTAGSGEGETYIAPVTTVPIPAGATSVDWSLQVGNLTAGEGFTATATDASTSDTSQFSECVAVPGASPSGGTLTGDITQAIDENVNLTSAGTSDWALWGYGLPTTDVPLTALTPAVSKANGGRQISNLTQVNPSGTLPRGFAFPSGVPFGFDWSDGNSPASATGAKAGLTAPKVGEGFSFTVPADTTQRTLKVWTSAHYANGTLTATLSDGSADPYAQTIQAVAGQFREVMENVPTVFTLHYAAASAGQTLTVAWTEDSSNGCSPSCDDVVIYAAALSGGGNATSITDVTLKPGTSVPISGSNDALADLSLDAFAPQQSGITPAPLNGLPLNGLPLNGLPLNGLPLNGLPLNGLPLNGLPLNGLPLNGLPLNGLPLNGLPLNGLPLNGLPLNGLSWDTLLAGTPLVGLPLQSVTLQQVLALPDPPAAVVNLKLGDLQLDASNLGKETIGALALGSTPINGLGSQASSIETQLQTWCESVTTSTTPAAACSLANIGNQSLFALGLAGAPLNGLPLNGLPLNGLPLNGLPLNGLPLNGLDLSASPLNGLPLNGLPLNGLFICPTGCDGLTIGDAIKNGYFAPGTTLGQLLDVLLSPASPVRDTVTLGDVLGFLIDRASVPWETLSPRLLSVFDTNRPTLGMDAAFTVQGTGTVPVTLKLTLPDGFDYDPSATATLTPSGGEGTSVTPDNVVGPTITFTLPNVQTGTAYTLSFRVRSGTTVGPAQGTIHVTSGGLSGSSTQPFTVIDSFEGNNSAGDAATIVADQNVEMSALATPGAVDYYKVAMPPAGTRLQVHLTNLKADYDLALYANQSTTVRTSSTDGVPLQDGTVADQQVNLQGGLNPQLTPTPLQDVPDPGIPVVQVSANRGTDDEDVGMVSPGGGGFAYIAVFGYNGASSPDPYTLRVTTKTPQAVTCGSRSFPSTGSTPDSLPTVGAGTNTLFLVNEQRIGATYGGTAENNLVAKLHELAGKSDLGVNGAVVPVEKLADYSAWDNKPCDVDAANAVANKIANYVATTKSGDPALKYVVFVGGDDQIPFFRIPDLSLIANENGYASSFSDNEYFGALASGDLLTDNPYLDTRPIPASGRQLFIPDLVGGRLVETADEITSAIDRFESSNGKLASSTAFVSGYDFVSDGSALVQSRLASTLGAGNVRTLISDTWTKSDLFGATFPTGGPADVNDWNGHYDNHQALDAAGNHTNLISTSDLTAPDTFNGGIFFTMGCHAGFQTTDAIVGAPLLDWAQYFAGTGTGFVGNTGFGIGNTDSVAFSEELMADLAGHLDGSLSIGEALTQAKRDYYLSRTAFGSYDEKTLSEAELYGLPMYGVGTSPAALAAAPLASPSPDPVTGTSSSTSPSEGSLSDLFTGVQTAAFDAVPQFSGPVTGDHGQYFTNAGQVQAPNYRPLQPYVTLPATRGGTLVAHGALIDGLTSADHTPFNPDNVRPTVDLSAAEPEPQFADEAWPTKIPTLVTLDDTGGKQQSLNLATGQFFTDSTDGSGVERLWTHITGRVTYSSSNDFDPPQIDSIDAFISNGHVAFSGKFSDTGTGVKVAQVVYDVDNGGTWVSLPLKQQSDTSWTGGAAFNGTHVQFFVEACDDAGNCGFSSNKGRYFDAAPLPANNGTITLTPSAQPQPGGFYRGSLNVTVASTTAQALTITLDGKAVTANPVPISGDGVHILEAQASDGASATGVYLIDTSAPSAPVITGIVDGTTYPIADLPPASAIGCTALDAVSGATCVVTNYSAAYGKHTLTATATDGAGNTSTVTLTYIVGLKSGDILPPMAAKSGDQTDPHASDLVVSKINSTLPLKFQMYLDGKRTKLMTTPPVGSVARLTLAKYDSTTDSTTDTVVIDSATADSGNVFRWESGQYQYNLKTKDLAAGTYGVTITVYAADGATVLARSDKQYFVLRK